MTRIAEFPETLDDRQREIAERIRSGPRGRVRGPLALWLYSPDLAERAQHLGEFLRFGTAFDKRLSELIIITVARHHECAYVWAIHTPIAIEAGIDVAVVEALRQNKQPAFERSDEKILYEGTRQLLVGSHMESEAFSSIVNTFGERGIIELTAIMGYYAMGAYLVNAVELPTPDASDPFDLNKG